MNKKNLNIISSDEKRQKKYEEILFQYGLAFAKLAKYDCREVAVFLQPLQESFFTRYTERFSPVVREMLHSDSIEQELLYLRTRLEQQDSGNSFFYCIFDAKDNDLIGAIEIRGQSSSAGQLYTWIHENYWGKGHFQQALALAAKQYFAASNARYFDAHVDVTNIRSYKALKKAGFADLGYVDGPHGKQFVVVLRNKSLS